MATRAKTPPAQEFLPADDETKKQLEFGRQMLAMAAQSPADEFPETVDDPDDIALANVLAELGSSAAESKVNIYQLDAKKGRAFVGTFIPSEFSIERIQIEFGPGDYEIRVYNTAGLATRKVVKIAAPRNPQQNAIVPGADNSGKLLEAMQTGFQQMGTMFANALGELARNQPKPKSTAETLQEFKLMKEVFGSPQTVQPAGPDPMAMFNMALELSEKIRPREGEPSTGEIIMKAVENFGPAITQMVQAGAQQPRFIPVPAQTPALPNPAPTQEKEMDIATRIYINTIIGAAASNADPMTYAGNILDLVDEGKVLAFINAPEWFTEVKKSVPAAEPYGEWFEQLKMCILELTSPENGSSVDGEAISMPAPPNAS